MFRKQGLMVLCLVITTVLFLSPAVSAQPETVTGIIYATYELEADDGIVYVVIADDRGEELATLDGSRVRVTGEIEEQGGGYTIKVSTFTVIDEEPQEQGQEDESMQEESPEEEPTGQDAGEDQPTN